MKAQGLSVKNYRCLVDVELPIRDLMVVIGPNGSGKTALLEIFQMLQLGSQEGLNSFLESQGGLDAVLSNPGISAGVPHVGVDLTVDVQSDRSKDPMCYRLELASLLWQTQSSLFNLSNRSYLFKGLSEEVI